MALKNAGPLYERKRISTRIYRSYDDDDNEVGDFLMKIMTSLQAKKSRYYGEADSIQG